MLCADVLCMQSILATSESSRAASFDAGEFESVKDDKTMKLASSYNWDQTGGPAFATSLDPNSDEFFNSMLADTNKVHYCRVASLRFKKAHAGSGADVHP